MSTELILNYLILANINEIILDYIVKHKIEIFMVIKELIGKDFEFFSSKEQNVQKLMNGNEYFKILEDGSIWFKISFNPNDERKNSKFYKGGNIKATTNEYTNTTISSYITFEVDHITDRNITINSKQDNIFDGAITENTFNKDFKKTSRKTAYWNNNSTPDIPKENLLTTTEFINEFGITTNTTKERLEFNNDAWNFILNGINLKKVVTEENTAQRKTLFNKLINLKNNLLNQKNENENEEKQKR